MKLSEFTYYLKKQKLSEWIAFVVIFYVVEYFLEMIDSGSEKFKYHLTLEISAVAYSILKRMGSNSSLSSGI